MIVCEILKQIRTWASSAASASSVVEDGWRTLDCACVNGWWFFHSLLRFLPIHHQMLSSYHQVVNRFVNIFEFRFNFPILMLKFHYFSSWFFNFVDLRSIFKSWLIATTFLFVWECDQNLRFRFPTKNGWLTSILFD